MARMRTLVLTVVVLMAVGATAAELKTPLAPADLDPAAFAAWVDGVETPIAGRERTPAWIIWTQAPAVGHAGLAFGDSKTPGVRHLRIGFAKPVAVGSVLTRANPAITLSFLKPAAAYPGDLSKDDQWTPAARAGASEFSVWSMPAGTTTRALRLTYDAPAAAKTYAGQVHGVYVLAERVANVAPAATVIASARPAAAYLLNNARDDAWAPWSSDENNPIVSAERPQTITLVWPAATKLAGLATIGAGFADGEIQAYAGPADRHPREASDADWKTVATIRGLKPSYPRSFCPDLFAFDKEVETRAVRLVITAAIDDTKFHPHLKGNAKNGKRVWAAEVMALRPLAPSETIQSVAGTAIESAHPPIPVKFTLDKDAFVTVVIEDEQGNRVRNLVSETPFKAGENTAWWDGTDDLGRDTIAPEHGVYHVPGQFVKPGTYKVRGLARQQIDLRYQFSVYSPGNPPWATADKSGGWLADHSPPSATLFLPGGGDVKPRVLISSHVAEGGDGLVYTDLQGNKVGAIHWIGGNWTGATHLARDAGEKNPTPDVHAYAAAPWEQDKDNKKGEIRLTALTAKGAKPLYTHKLATKVEAEVSGLAVHDGLLVAALPKGKQLLFVDTAKGAPLGVASLEGAKGLAFRPTGELLVIRDKAVMQYRLGKIDGGGGINLPIPKILIKEGLDDPDQLTLDRDGNLFISDRGQSHQVKVFDASGKFLRAIGTPGAPSVGPYDPTHMSHPAGLTIDSENRLWVAENDHLPKRVSVWSLDGKLINAFYGPPQYGGGGTIDSAVKSRFFYAGMEFKLDWEKGNDQLMAVYYRPGVGLQTPKQHYTNGSPETPIHANGRTYLHNSFTANPTNGTTTLTLFTYDNGVATPCMAFGRADEWELLKADALLPRWPGGKLPDKNKLRSVLFVWSDVNSDGRPQPDEVQMTQAESGTVMCMADLTLLTATALQLKPTRITDKGVPVYDLAAATTLVKGARPANTSGGGQAMLADDGWLILTVPPEPFPRQSSLSAAKDGKPLWTYPNLWPGLHPSHTAPLPDRPGQLIGTTRLLGYPFKPSKNSDVELWAINGNKGNVYLMTTDGLFVATLFEDGRRSSWAMPRATRDMLVNDASLNEEDFWPSLTHTNQGETYLVAGVQTTCSIVKVENLDAIKRLPDSSLKLSEQDLAAARDHFLAQAAAKQQQQGRDTLTIPIRKVPPTVDGSLDDWSDANWVTIDTRRKQTGDWGSVEEKATAAATIAEGRLYLAYRTNEKDFLKNAGDSKELLFKTGSALDLMLATDPLADPKRKAPAAGDVRLLVTMAKKKPTAVLYRAVVPGTKDPVPFRAPWHSITIDRVDDVSADLQLAGDDKGNYEVSIPLKTLGVPGAAVAPGEALTGDLGLLRGNGFQTLQRVYWSNKGTNLTADVPSEAMLTPQLWGKIVFK
jgi:hypothetical protein